MRGGLEPEHAGVATTERHELVVGYPMLQRVPHERRRYRPRASKWPYGTRSELGCEAWKGERTLKVVVTGGAGFIGSHLVDTLVARGDSVVVVDNLFSGYRENVNLEAELIEASVADEKAVRAAVEDAEIVFHQAAQRAVLRSVEDPVSPDQRLRPRPPHSRNRGPRRHVRDQPRRADRRRHVEMPVQRERPGNVEGAGPFGERIVARHRHGGPFHDGFRRVDRALIAA